MFGWCEDTQDLMTTDELAGVGGCDFLKWDQMVGVVAGSNLCFYLAMATTLCIVNAVSSTSLGIVNSMYDQDEIGRSLYSKKHVVK